MHANLLKTIEQICEKFNYKIQPSTVYKWLANFNNEDYLKALEVLYHLEYFSHEDIINEFNNSMIELVEFVENDVKKKLLSRIMEFLFKEKTKLFLNIGLKKRIILHPIGGITKSGVNMIYPLTKTPTYEKYKEYFQIIIDEEKLGTKIKENAYLVLFDDIVGSGDTLVKYYNKSLKKQLVKTNNVTILSLSVVYMTKAQEKLNKLNIIPLGNARNRAFSDSGSVFGYRYKMRIIRDFAFKYGADLYITKNQKTGTIKSHNLGHNNSQALVVFAHSTPNNTLPIIWSSTNNWIPLFPRFSKDKINSCQKFKSETRRWMSLLSKVGFSRVFMYNKYSNIDLQLLMILRLIKMGKNKQSICQFLEISSKIFDDIITKGKEKNIFCKHGKITLIGHNIYAEIQKLEKISLDSRNQTLIYMNNYENIDYLPEMFRGES